MGRDRIHGSIVLNKPGLKVAVAQLPVFKSLAADGEALVQVCLVELLCHCLGATGIRPYFLESHIDRSFGSSLLPDLKALFVQNLKYCFLRFGGEHA